MTATIDGNDDHNSKDDDDNGGSPSQRQWTPFNSPSTLSLHSIVVCPVMTSPSEDLLAGIEGIFNSALDDFSRLDAKRK
jgi:hypothetical protein